MKMYVAISSGKAVSIFGAEDVDEPAMIDDQKGSMRSDLKVRVGPGKPMWNGKSAIEEREGARPEMMISIALTDGSSPEGLRSR
jgi:hypothetical protein